MAYANWETMSAHFEANYRFMEAQAKNLESILGVLESWDGKRVNKRLGDALERECGCFYINRHTYGNGADLAYWDYEMRSYDDGRGATGYVSDWLEGGILLLCEEYNEPLDYEQVRDRIAARIRTLELMRMRWDEYKECGEHHVRRYNEAVETIASVQRFIGDEIMDALGMTSYVRKVRYIGPSQ